jgi:hypothetical protein
MNFKLALLGLAVCASAVVQATPLGLGASFLVDLPSAIESGTNPVVKTNAFTVGGITGNVNVTIYGDDANNTLGGLTFIYDISNAASSVNNGEGVISFSVGGWGTHAMAFDYAGADPLVLPLEVKRSVDGSTVTITFPFDQPNTDQSGPPIFPNQQSYRLFLYTEATTVGVTSASFESAQDVNGGGYASNGGTTYSTGENTSVPDDSSTALLASIGLALAAVSAISRKRKKA